MPIFLFTCVYSLFHWVLMISLSQFLGFGPVTDTRFCGFVAGSSLDLRIIILNRPTLLVNATA